MQNIAMRERMFTMRLSAEESTRLDGVAAHYGLNAANLLRMLLKREEDRIAMGSRASDPTAPRVMLPELYPPKKSRAKKGGRS